MLYGSPFLILPVPGEQFSPQARPKKRIWRHGPLPLRGVWPWAREHSWIKILLQFAARPVSCGWFRGVTSPESERGGALTLWVFQNLNPNKCNILSKYDMLNSSKIPFKTLKCQKLPQPASNILAVQNIIQTYDICSVKLLKGLVTWHILRTSGHLVLKRNKSNFYGRFDQLLRISSP